MPIVTRSGFHSEAPIRFAKFGDGPTGASAIDAPNDADGEALLAQHEGSDVIRIAFPHSGDGRGFSLARRLRALGYSGRLRAAGGVIPDQFSYALDTGFDEVEIDEAHAQRQPEQDWVRDVRPPSSYRDRLRRGRGFPAPAGVFDETVTEVEHYADRLFRFRITRPASFRFRSGEFAMIGLPNAEKPVFRAYSVASPAWDETLEFYSIKVPDGPLTSRLQRIREGDRVLLRKKATGTLIGDALTPGERLFLLSTGTGVAPFASLIRDPETYERFGEVVLCHTTRTRAELVYGAQVVAQAKADPLVGEEAATRLRYHPTTTQEDSAHTGRITDAIRSGALFRDLQAPPLSAATDRVMICGSRAMLDELSEICAGLGLGEGATNRPGEYVIERAFVG